MVGKLWLITHFVPTFKEKKNPLKSSCRFFSSPIWQHIDVAKQTDRVGFGSILVNQVVGRVCLDWPVFFTWIFLFFIFYFYKENNIYLLFWKLCNKLLNVKCIILNSPLILRMNSVKLINTYSIILKLYKS